MSGLYRVLILSQHKVVFAHGDDEYDGSDAFKTVNPFLAFRSLAADVEHSDSADRMRSFVHDCVRTNRHIIQQIKTAFCFDDCCRLRTWTKIFDSI